MMKKAIFKLIGLSLATAVIFTAVSVVGVFAAAFGPDTRAAAFTDETVQEASSNSIDLRVERERRKYFLVWEPTDYDVYVIFSGNTEIGIAAEPRIEITNIIIDAGAYDFRVAGIKNGAESELGALSYENFVQLDSPRNLRFSNGVLGWDRVFGATAYRVIVNGADLGAVRETELDLSAILFHGRSYSVKIKAYNDSANARYYTDSESSIFEFDYFTAPARSDNLFVAYFRGRLTASWNRCAFADRYSVVLKRVIGSVTIEAASFETTACSLDLTDSIEEGAYYILTLTPLNEAGAGDARLIGFSLSQGRLTVTEVSEAAALGAAL